MHRNRGAPIHHRTSILFDTARPYPFCRLAHCEPAPVSSVARHRMAKSIASILAPANSDPDIFNVRAREPHLASRLKASPVPRQHLRWLPMAWLCGCDHPRLCCASRVSHSKQHRYRYQGFGDRCPPHMRPLEVKVRDREWNAVILHAERTRKSVHSW